LTWKLIDWLAEEENGGGSGVYVGSRNFVLAVAVTLGTSLVQSRLEYANSIMYGMSASNMQKLQCAQNSLTHVVLPFLSYLSASQ